MDQFPYRARVFLEEYHCTVEVLIPKDGVLGSLVEMNHWKGQPEDHEEVSRTRVTVPVEEVVPPPRTAIHPMNPNVWHPLPHDTAWEYNACTGAVRKR